MADGSGTTRPLVALLIPTNRQAEMLTPDALSYLRRVAEVREVAGDSAAVAARLAPLLADADACLTGWGTPTISEEAVEGAARLRLIAHCAGSVKRLIPPGVFGRGVVVCHATTIIADSV